MENIEKKNLAVNLFREGYNCAQSVAIAFHEECGLPKEMIENLSAPFGGGLGRQREICGAVSGMCMVLGAVNKFDDNDRHTARKDVYGTTQKLCGEFKERHGSIICREILKGAAPTNPEPSARTAEYYAKRPCERCVEDAAEIIDRFIKSK